MIHGLAHGLGALIGTATLDVVGQVSRVRVGVDALESEVIVQILEGVTELRSNPITDVAVDIQKSV